MAAQRRDCGWQTTAAKLWAQARQRPPLSEGTRCRPGTSVRTVRLTGGHHAVLIFSNLSKTGSTLKIKNGCLILLQKIPNFCMWLTWDIMNNFLNCADMQFPTETELKILDQIQHLNI
jgi:hypothetical protein